jgi:hypothetical protein
MFRMVGPAPRQQHVYVEQVSHGKSASISRTDSVLSGGRSARGAKIIAPVYLHLIRAGAGPAVLRPVERRRRYSERVIFSRLARERIRRASSSLTLKDNVFTGKTVLQSGHLVKRYLFPLPGACPVLDSRHYGRPRIRWKCHRRVVQFLHSGPGAIAAGATLQGAAPFRSRGGPMVCVSWLDRAYLVCIGRGDVQAARVSIFELGVLGVERGIKTRAR